MGFHLNLNLLWQISLQTFVPPYPMNDFQYPGFNQMPLKTNRVNKYYLYFKSIDLFHYYEIFKYLFFFYHAESLFHSFPLVSVFLIWR